MKNILHFLNPIQWLKAHSFAKQNAKFDKSTYDLELYLYSEMLNNKMLHYAYFEDTEIKPEDISFRIFEEAQIRYADNIIKSIKTTKDAILDVGCGMGGLAEMMHHKEFNVECLTPNKNQINFINIEIPELITHHCKYEEFDGNQKYGTIINSESLQYIPMKEAISKTNELILPLGQWVISDYFSIAKIGDHQKPHHLESFLHQVQKQGWTIVSQKDITHHILPTLTYIDMYVNRLIKPLKHYGFEKLRFKKPKLFYMVSKLRNHVDAKIEKETRTVDPEVFLNEKKYMFLILEKS